MHLEQSTNRFQSSFFVKPKKKLAGIQAQEWSGTIGV